MQIRMNILPYRYYNVIKRYVTQEKQWKKQGRCYNLRIEDLTPEEIESYKKLKEEKDIPTHRIFFSGFEDYLFIEGRIIENSTDKLIIEIEKGREYEFFPFRYVF